MITDEAIQILEKQIVNPSIGLPDKIFEFVTRVTPMINVDLLIKDEHGRILLSWREAYLGHSAGWHIPGGIIRYKEDAATRIRKVAETEIGAEIQFEPEPVAIHQIICDHDTRGHFISLLYRCFLSSDFNPENIGLTTRDQGYLKWHEVCPENLVQVQEIYRKSI